MRPASTTTHRAGARHRRWPAAVSLLALGALVAPAVAQATSDSTPPTTPADPASSTPAGGSTDGKVTYPMTFQQAKDAGLEGTIDWGARCDTKLGTLAMPWFFAQPCMVPFQGDNGGATEQGVTDKEITIAWYLPMKDDPVMAYLTAPTQDKETQEEKMATMNDFIALFEQYYETYGRHLKVVPVQASGSAIDETAARADAVHIAKDIKPFMVWGGPLTTAFADELAANKVMCMDCNGPQTAQWRADHDPYMWSSGQSAVQTAAMVLEMIQKQLAGKNATHSEQFKDTPRKFGYLVLEGDASATEDSKAFIAEMEKAGAPVAVHYGYKLDPATIQESAAQGIAKLKDAGVTTVVFSGDPVAPGAFTREATSQGYFPEWVLVGGGLMDITAFGRTYDQEQWKHAFGWSAIPARQVQQNQSFYRLYKWWYGKDPQAPKQLPLFGHYVTITAALLQGIGPELTYANWKKVIFTAASTRRAITAPSLSWGDSKSRWPDVDYFGVDDATLIWWDAEATGPDEIGNDGKGMYQWVDGGKRYLLGEFPAEDKFFVKDGAVALYEKPPADEQYPDYQPLPH